MKKLVAVLLIGLLAISLPGCWRNSSQQDNNGQNNGSLNERNNIDEQQSNEEQKDSSPSLAGLHLGDSAAKVSEILGDEYTETTYDMGGHFLEPYIVREYAKGVTVILGQESQMVFEVRSTKSPFATNLGAKVGDSAETVLSLYRARYKEPESIHGGLLPGVFKVEDGVALIFDFNIEDGLVNPEPIADEDRVERIILTTPMFLDDDF